MNRQSLNWMMIGVAPVCVVLGMALLLVFPSLLLTDFHPKLPILTHLFTLGGLVSAYYVVQDKVWNQAYGNEGKPWLLWLAWALHIIGLVLFLWGFQAFNTLLVYWGGHYLVPTGVVLFMVHGVVIARRRPKGSARHLWSHLPGLGLLVTIAIGAMLVMDKHSGDYGIYGLNGFLVHFATGGFLFVAPLLAMCDIPALGLARGSDKTPSENPASNKLGTHLPQALPQPRPGQLKGLYLMAGVGSAAVLVIALGVMNDTAGNLMVGMVLLAALALWNGLPSLIRRANPWDTLPGLRRLGWVAVGVLLAWAAIRLLREGEQFFLDPLWMKLLRLMVLAFMLQLALPDMLSRLMAAAGQPEKLILRSYRVWMVALGFIAVGYLAGDFTRYNAWILRGGAAIWIFGMLGPLLFVVGGARRNLKL